MRGHNFPFPLMVLAVTVNGSPSSWLNQVEPRATSPIAKKAGDVMIVPEHPAPLQTERLPLGIWLHIIDSSDLTPIELRDLSLISKFLAWVVQPLLFRSSVFIHTRASAWPSEHARDQDASYAAQLEARLQFATLSRIAPAVQSINIAPEVRNDPSGLQALSGNITHASVVVNGVLLSLSHFPNLKTLHLSHVIITPKRGDRLASVPLLEGLHLETCPGSERLDLPVSHLHLRYLALRGDMGGTLGFWLPLLRCPTIEHLSYGTSAGQTNPDDPDELVFPALAASPVMRSLRTLHLPGASYRFPSFSMALLQCRSVREIYITDSEQFDGQLPWIAPDRELQLSPEALPHLRAIRAPYEFIMSCIGDRPVMHVTTNLTRFLRSSYKEPQYFRVRFAGLQELAVNVTDIAPERILWLTPSFPRLEALFVDINNSGIWQDAKTVLAYLETVIWPQSLKSLHVHYHAPEPRSLTPVLGVSEQADEGVDGKDLRNEHMRVLESIERRCPAIEDIYLSLLGDTTRWTCSHVRPLKWYEWPIHEHRKSFLQQVCSQP